MVSIPGCDRCTSKIHETFERRSVFHPQVQTTTRRQRYGLNGRNQFVRCHLRDAVLRQPSDGNFVETGLLSDAGEPSSESRQSSGAPASGCIIYGGSTTRTIPEA